uniref:Uncharacterized protein n=1 Tax=Nothobranchius pienaari TaxID=704102 RepID=A0A1A8MHC4_9TELE
MVQKWATPATLVCAVRGWIFRRREMIPHEVQRTRPPIVLCSSSRCDITTLSPTTLGSSLIY